jgi:chromosome segregation ATPase
MKADELELCLRAQAQTIESLLSQLAHSDTAPLAGALQAALQREELLKRQCNELLESMHQDIDDDKRMSVLAQSLDSQNQDLLGANSRLKEEVVVLSEQVNRLRRSASPMKSRTPSKQQAVLEHVEELLATKDFFNAGNKWRDTGYQFIEADSDAKNFENLRDIVKLRDKQLTSAGRDLRTKPKDPNVDRLIREIKEKDAEIDILKNSVLTAHSPGAAFTPDVRTLRDKVKVLEDGISSREHDIRELLGEYEALRSELKRANEQLSQQEQELAVLKDLPGDYRIEDLVREAEEAKGLLSYKEQEVKGLLEDLVEAQKERESLKYRLSQVQSTHDEAQYRKAAFEKDAQLLRLQTELTILKSRSPYTDLRERLRRALLRTDQSATEAELELKEVLSAVDTELSKRVSEQLAVLEKTWTSDLAKAQRLEHESRGTQGLVEQSRAETQRTRALYDTEYKAHQKCLQLLKDSHPSIAEYELMREEYFRGLQANLNRIIEQLTQRVETLAADIRDKNEEILRQEARYEADITAHSDKLKAERAKYKETGDRLNLEIARHKETKSRLDAYEERGVYHTSEDVKRLTGSLRDSELNLTVLQGRVQDLQLQLVEKTRRIELLEREALSYKEQTDRLKASEQALYNELAKVGKQQAEGLNRSRQDLEQTQLSNTQKLQINQLEEENASLKAELSTVKDDLHSVDSRLQGLRTENSQLKEEQRMEVNDLKLKLQALQHQSFEESDDALRKLKDKKAGLERELRRAKEQSDQLAEEIKELKAKTAQQELDKQQLEAALEEERSKSKQQATSLKQTTLELARLKRIEEQSDELSTDNEIFKQEIETLQQEKQRLRRKLDSIEDSRRVDSGQLVREQDDSRTQLEFMRKEVRTRQLASKEEQVLELQASLEELRSGQAKLKLLDQKESTISQLTDQVTRLSQELDDERDEKRGLSLRVSQLKSVAEGEAPESYKSMWHHEKERIGDLTKELRRAKDSAEDYRGLLDNLLEYIEQTGCDWKATEVKGSDDLAARVLAAKEITTELLGCVKAQRVTLKSVNSSIDRKAEETLRRLEQLAVTVEEQLRSTENVQHSTVLALICDKIAAEKELYEKSRCLLDSELFLQLPDEGLNKWALQKWQEAEREVCRLRSQLLDSAKKMEQQWRKYDPGQEVIELRKQLERSTTQLQSLQKAVNWLQSERQKGSAVPQDTLKSGVEASTLRAHIDALMDEVDTYKAQASAKDRQIEALHRGGFDQQRHLIDHLRSQAEAAADELGFPCRFDADSRDMSSVLQSLATLLGDLTHSCRREREENKDLREELGQERQGLKQSSSALQESVDSLRKEKAGVEHHVKELAAQVRTMSRELEHAKEGLLRSSAQEDLTKSAFERGRVMGVSEGRQQERKELEIESRRMQDLVREYKQSREELKKTQERLMLRQKT